ncbi:hypothetical protein ACVNIS_11220 [Sphaerotilaceae bacterium SBD11-9]
MRRWLIIFLLFLVPFQMVWGAAAPYCAHEAKSSAAAKHFGHHDHEHKGANGSSSSGNGSGAHLDCESCHLGCGVTLPPLGIAITTMPVQTVLSTVMSPFTSHVPSGPERPDRINHLAAARFGGDVAFDPMTT